MYGHAYGGDHSMEYERVNNVKKHISAAIRK